MDFMKVFDQTVREIKREVNLKVLKVPEIEQKTLDATSDEPWGPHGSALSELALATKKFSECQMIMTVLWNRLTDTGANWRHVYKALAVIEYFIANGSERALDDILEHSFRISSLSGFEYVEPNGKDVGINVRKKVETLVALLTDKEKIKAVRDKAATTRDKYFGLSSTGISYKSSSSSYGSSFESGDRYGGFGSSPEGDSFKDSYKDSEGYDRKDSRSKEGPSSGKLKGTTRHARDHDSLSSSSSKMVTKPGPANNSDDDFDDFDPRGSSTTANTTSNEVDLFGDSLVGDLMDAPTSSPTKPASSSPPAPPEVDLFADADFVSAPPHTEATTGSHSQANIDLFASQPAFPAPVPASVDLFGTSESGFPSEIKYSATEPTNKGTFDPFAASDVGMKSETKSSNLEPISTKAFDPFAAIPMNNFEGSDPFGAFTLSSEPVATKPHQNLMNNNLSSLEQTSLTSSNSAPKKETFQVKSGIWADSLSRGLIDLNITAPKTTNLADIGIVGGLGDVSDEKELGPPTAWYMGRAMGAGSGMGRSGLSSSSATGGGGSFSTLGQQQYGGFK